MSVASKAFYLAVFFLFINAASAITMLVVEDADGNKFFNMNARQYDFEDSDGIVIELNSTTRELSEAVRASGQLEDKGNQVYRVLDVMGLGFIMRLYDFVTLYMYGPVSMLEAIIGPMLEPDVKEVTFNTMRWAVFILYIVAFISIVANKKIAETFD